jgi:hypothetical protein
MVDYSCQLDILRVVVWFNGSTMEREIIMIATTEVLDSREILERLEELQNRIDNEEDLSEDEEKSLACLREIDMQGRSVSEDWEYGATLIRKDYFTSYAKEMLEDCGDIPKNIPWYVEIDWEKTAYNLLDDYSEVTIQGKTYYVR